jgi:hypothetical protein
VDTSRTSWVARARQRLRPWGRRRAGLPEIAVGRTGGIVGMQDRVVIGPSGRWTLSDPRGDRASGRLTDDQYASVRASATDPRLAIEAQRPPEPSNIADAVHFSVAVGSVHIPTADSRTQPVAFGLIMEVLRIADGH